MKLQDFYRRVGPFLLGEQSHSDAVLALYGSEPPQPDAERLAIYGRFCRNHRHEVLDGIFVALRALVVARKALVSAATSMGSPSGVAVP